MTTAEIEDYLQNKIQEICPEQDCKNLNTNLPLKEQIRFDSMDFLDLIMFIKEDFKFMIPEEDFAQLTCIFNFTNYLNGKI